MEMKLLEMNPGHYDTAREILTEMIATKMPALEIALVLVAAVEHLAIGSSIAAKEDRKQTIVDSILIMLAQLRGMEESAVALAVLEAGERVYGKARVPS